MHLGITNRSILQICTILKNNILAAANMLSWKAKGCWIDSSLTQIPSPEDHQSKTAKNIFKLQIQICGLTVEIIRFNLRGLNKGKLGSTP